MEDKHIPQINQDFDFKLLLHVLGKNLIWVLFLFVISLTSAFLLIRYTKPIYRAKAVIQLTGEAASKDVLDERLNPYTSKNIAKEIELLRSPVFLERVLKKVPQDVSYFKKGAILNFETYKSSPFLVEIDSIKPEVFSKRFDVIISNRNEFLISSADGTLNKTRFKFGEIVSTPSSTFRVKPNRIESASEGDVYFFTFNNPEYFVPTLLSSLNIKILSEAAKTIEISATDFNPQKVADIVNAIALEFEFFNIEKKQEGANRVLEYIDKTLGIISQKLSETDRELSKYKPEEVFDNDLFAFERGKSYERQLSYEAKEELLLNDLALIKYVQKIDITGKNDVISIQAFVAGSGIQSSLAPGLERFNQLFTTREDILYAAPENSPLFNKVNYQLNEHKSGWESSLIALEGALKDKLEKLRSKNKELVYSGIVPFEVLDTNNLSASMLKRIKDVNEKFFNQLIEKKAEYSIAKEGFTPEYQVLEFAKVSDSPIAPDRRVILMTAFAAWLLLSIFLIGVRYILNDEILLINDISKYTDASILGMIHKYKEDIPVSQLVVDKKPKGLIAEAFRTARTNLQFIYNEEGPKIISLTSTISGEGKTFVSINLSGILAFSGSRVIILDCDMRKPKIHVGFETHNDYGMSTILIGQDNWKNCVRKSGMENLHFITAGPIPPNPAELMMSKRMDDLIDELKKDYEYIVIDNPPVGLVSDAVVNLQRAHYPIYIFRSDYSRKFFINNLNRLKRENKISSISCILNSVDITKNKSYGSGYGYGSYNYGYGYGYGFGYYEEEKGTGSESKTASTLLNILKGKRN